MEVIIIYYYYYYESNLPRSCHSVRDETIYLKTISGPHCDTSLGKSTGELFPTNSVPFIETLIVSNGWSVQSTVNIFKDNI